MNRWLCLMAALCLLLGNQAFADKVKPVLSVDSEVPSFVRDLQFPDADTLQAEQSDFHITNVLIMSSETGERWATITLKNSAAGQRLLVSKHLVGVFADGSRHHPITLNETLAAGEAATFTIFFGVRKFPLLYIDSRN